MDSRQTFLDSTQDQNKGAIGRRNRAFLVKTSKIILFFNMNVLSMIIISNQALSWFSMLHLIKAYREFYLRHIWSLGLTGLRSAP